MKPRYLVKPSMEFCKIKTTIVWVQIPPRPYVRLMWSTKILLVLVQEIANVLPYLSSLKQYVTVSSKKFE